MDEINQNENMESPEEVTEDVEQNEENSENIPEESEEEVSEPIEKHGKHYVYDADGRRMYNMNPEASQKIAEFDDYFFNRWDEYLRIAPHPADLIKPRKQAPGLNINFGVMQPGVPKKK